MQKDRINGLVLLLSCCVVFALCLLFASLASCKAHKHSSVVQTCSVDSAAVSASQLVFSQSDSCSWIGNLDFDTLTLSVSRPVQFSDIPQVVTLRAVKGSASSQKKFHSQIQQTHNTLDSVAFKANSYKSSEAISKHDSPSGTSATILLITSLVIIASFFLVCFFTIK